MSYIHGQSWGVEYELGSITRDEVKQAEELRRLGFVDKHDASIESHISMLRSDIRVLKSPRSLAVNSKGTRSGAELVSRVFTEENPLDIFKFVTNWVATHGEVPRNNRCGIHFHISFPPGELVYLKNVIKLASHLEQVFFYVGGMGYEFRGLSNDSIFCRPITEKGPVCVKSARRWRPIFDLNDLIKAKSKSTFWDMYGDSRNLQTTRYVPVRYMWINLLPILTQGSLEFRIFNQTLNPHYLWAALELCKSFAKSAMKDEIGEIKTNSILAKHTKEGVLDTLNNFANDSGMDELAFRFLRDIIAYTPDMTLPNEWVKTHLRNPPTVWPDGSEYRSKPIQDEVKNPTFIDIHNIG